MFLGFDRDTRGPGATSLIRATITIKLTKAASEYLDNMVEYISCLKRVSSCSLFIIFYIFSYFIDHRCFDNLE